MEGSGTRQSLASNVPTLKMCRGSPSATPGLAIKSCGNSVRRCWTDKQTDAHSRRITRHAGSKAHVSITTTTYQQPDSQMLRGPLKFPLHEELTLSALTHTSLSCSAEGSDPAYSLVAHCTTLFEVWSSRRHLFQTPSHKACHSFLLETLFFFWKDRGPASTLR